MNRITERARQSATDARLRAGFILQCLAAHGVRRSRREGHWCLGRLFCRPARRGQAGCNLVHVSDCNDADQPGHRVERRCVLDPLPDDRLRPVDRGAGGADHGRHWHGRGHLGHSLDCRLPVHRSNTQPARRRGTDPRRCESLHVDMVRRRYLPRPSCCDKRASEGDGRWREPCHSDEFDCCPEHRDQPGLHIWPWACSRIRDAGRSGRND